jgi:hypothetical protein
VDSPTESTFASEVPRCAPPHTNGAGEEPCRGGRVCPTRCWLVSQNRDAARGLVIGLLGGKDAGNS